MHEIDEGIAWIDSALADLDRESNDHRHQLEQFSSAARTLDEAGLVDEAAAMLDGQRAIENALAENERRRIVLTDVATKLLAARPQIAPDESLSSPDQDIVYAESARPVAATEQEHGVPRVAAMSPIVAVAPPADDQEAVKPPVPVLTIFGLLLLASIMVLVAAMLGDDDEDTDQGSEAGLTLSMATVMVPSPTPTAIAPSPTATQIAVMFASPTSPVPTSTVRQSPAVIAPQPTPRPQLQPTSTPMPLPPTPLPLTPTPRPQATSPPTQPTAIPLETVIDRVVAAEAGLRSGQIDAVVAYSDGTRSSATIRFDLGVQGEVGSVAIATTYQSAGQTSMTEQIMVGARVWERADDGNWQEASNAEGVWGQVQAFLPRLATVPNPQQTSDERPGELHWYDAVRDADVTLRVNPESGQPEQIQTVTRATGSVLTISYTSWNTPTQIDPPVS